MEYGKQNWLEALLPLRRPEYAKQTEALLTDLLWRSQGSELTGGTKPYFARLRELAAGGSQRAEDPERLVLAKHANAHVKLFATSPLATDPAMGSLVRTITGASPLNAIISSILAPRARGATVEACVPVHPSAVAFQTLHGLVNKSNPADMAAVIEAISVLGGAPGLGSAAEHLLTAFHSRPQQPHDGLAGLLDNVFPLLSASVWAGLPAAYGKTIGDWPAWPSCHPQGIQPSIPAPLMASCNATPFAWFWDKWTVLCDPANGWFDYLPTRRWVDWAGCLVRTALAFSYVWEAELMCRIHEGIVAKHKAVSARHSFRAMFAHPTTLAVLEPASVPASQKDMWPPMAALLARGHVARGRIWEVVEEELAAPTGNTIADKIESWINTLQPAVLADLAAPLEIDDSTANTLKEFVRYLLLARATDEDSGDQGDFYYLCRTNSKRNVWYSPGPEWLVVVVSILCRKPRHRTTLGVLIQDLSRLGIRADRSQYVAMLEEAGLSSDSPDADDALVIASGF